MAIFNSELLNPIKIPIKAIKIHYKWPFSIAIFDDLPTL
jgi:hypothetical protein